jgi:16S rRNA (adenine1518-N6/adenine1519-N6)-dimethyltransferase
MSKQPAAKRSLGQNFLVDAGYINKIIQAVSPSKGECIFEIGPGRGAITEQLIAAGARVIAIELDRELVPRLKEQFKSATDFHVIESDALETDFRELASTHCEGERVKLVANLPYYISTAILQKLIEQREIFTELILMFQREVVDRITAEPGNSERGFLTVMTETFLTAEKLFDVPPGAFCPQPKIWSSVVRLRPNESSVSDIDRFRSIISASFAQSARRSLTI